MRININVASVITKLLMWFIMITLYFVLTFPVIATEKFVFSTISNSSIALPASEILRQAYKLMGIDVEVIPQPALRSHRFADSGGADGVLFADRKIEDKNNNLIRIDIPLVEAYIYLFTKKENAFHVDGWQSIPKDYIVGYIRGVKFAESAINEYGLNGDPANSREQLFQKLERGRIQVAVSGRGGMEYVVDNGIVILEPSVYVSRVFHYLNKKHINLQPAITLILADMEKTGMIDDIFRQELGGN